MDDRVRRDDALLGRVRLDDFELDGVHGLPDEEEVALPHRSVGLEEVGLEVDVEQIARDAFDRVIQR